MSVARGFPNAGHFYANIVKPIYLTCNFIVDSTNGNGLGIRSLKSNGYIQNVFMNTSASFTGTTHTGTNSVTAISPGTSALSVGMGVQTTDLPVGTTIASIVSSTAITLSGPATTGHAGATITYQGVGANGLVNPNPAAGLAFVQFKQNFNYYLGGFSGFVSPVGSPTTSTNSGLTSGNAYVITVLGTTTLAEWQSIGLPPGFTPTVGQTIIVPSGVTGTGGSHTGKVGIPGVSGITSVEVIGDPNQEINNASIATNAGAIVVVQFLGATNSGTTTLIPTAPNAGSVVGMTFFFDGSSVTIDGL